MRLNNTLKNYKVFLEQPTGSKPEPSMKGPEDLFNSKNLSRRNFSLGEDSWPSEEWQDFKFYTKSSMRCGKENLENMVWPFSRTSFDL